MFMKPCYVFRKENTCIIHSISTDVRFKLLKTNLKFKEYMTGYKEYLPTSTAEFKDKIL